MLNGLFIYYNIMHLIFLEKLTTFQYILSPILACISIQVILYFPKICIFSYPMFYSVYKKEKKPGEIHASINKLVKKVKQRMIIFFIIMWLVTLLNVFYLVCFCSIWNGTQPKLYYDFLISLLIFLILTIIIASIIAALRYYGFHNNNEKLLKIQKSLKDFFVFF
jgi:ABC-type bacteriocin/lantibiotic exporter with double-glycine peptidase domain